MFSQVTRKNHVATLSLRSLRPAGGDAKGGRPGPKGPGLVAFCTVSRPRLGVLPRSARKDAQTSQWSSAGGGADDADEADALTGRAAEVVREAEGAALVDGLDRALRRCLTPQLEPALEQHAQPGRTDGMTERLEPTIRIHGKITVEVERAVEHVLPCVTAR